jgi:hypothetical protein
MNTGAEKRRQKSTPAVLVSIVHRFSGSAAYLEASLKSSGNFFFRCMPVPCERKLFRSSYDEAAALGRMDPVALSGTLLRPSRIFSGSGKTMVVFFSTPISVRVWR